MVNTFRRRPVIRILLAFPVLFTGALTGCAATDDAPGGPVGQAVRSWVAAVADRDSTRACALMTEPAQRQLRSLQATADCASAVRRFADALGQAGRDDLRRIEITRVSFPSDDRAVVDVDGPGQRLELRRVDGAWRLDDLGAATRISDDGAYPPPTDDLVPTPPTPTR